MPSSLGCSTKYSTIMLMVSKKRIDAKNLALITTVLILAAVVGVLIPYLRSRGNQPGAFTPSGQHDYTVTYGPNGFQPKEITIKLGQIVAWENPTGRPVWVGSDPHPAHTDLPGFDQKQINRAVPRFIGQAYAHGEAVYEYKFTKRGRWGYHNHLYPGDTGTVIVE